jgi:hypothetical protein
MIVIRVRWTWGGGVIARASPFSIICDVLEAHGFSGPAQTRLIVACLGRVIDPAFSFSHYRIPNGSTIACLLRRLPSRDKSRRFLDSLAPPPPDARAFEADPAFVREQLRLTDLTFAAWDDDPATPIDLLRQREEGMKEIIARAQLPAPVTIVAATPTIGETPLPKFERGDTATFCKNAAKWRRFAGEAPIPSDEPDGKATHL